MAEEEKEGIDLDAAYSKDEAESSSEDEKEDEAEGEAEGSEESEDKASDDAPKKDPTGGLGDLMDIFAEESEDTESTAGLFQQFLEELTMDQVSDEADRLLEEFRAI
ncbi:MAG: hypothetical protein HQ478_10440 [Chloroflexi bacterium]|nr:hypothetical protein [Chloroflexota bacterium]